MMNNLKYDQVFFFICAELNNISPAKLSLATPSNVKLICANNIRVPKKVLDKICQNWKSTTCMACGCDCIRLASYCVL